MRRVHALVGRVVHCAVVWLEAQIKVREGVVDGEENRDEVGRRCLENTVVDVDPVPPGCPGFLGNVRVVVSEADRSGHQEAKDEVGLHAAWTRLPVMRKLSHVPRSSAV